MSSVRVENLAKRFGTTDVVSDVSLDVAEGEFLALLGPSGSGKTTLLRLIAGFETVDAGRIFLDGDDVTERPALERRCGMVFQHYALFPHLTVGENVGYGLAASKISRDVARERVGEVLEMVDLAGFQDRAVTALSGGQQQRVAVARALAPRPRVLLLDEPLSNLDPSLRERTRHELREVVRRTRVTTILVTHEQEEAFDLADRVAVLHLGKLEQLARPEELYDAPSTPFVARFVGRASRLSGQVLTNTNGRAIVRAAGADWHAIASPDLSGAVSLLVRPEGARFSSGGPVRGVVARRRFAGSTAYFTITLNDGGELEVAASSQSAAVGDPAALEPTGIAAFAYPVEST